MSLGISNLDISMVTLGNTNIEKVYLGTQLVYICTHNIFVFYVRAGQTLYLYPPDDGVPLYNTDWGDGARGGFQHTYTNAGTYTVTTNCRLVNCVYVEAASEDGDIQPRLAPPEPVMYQYDTATLDSLMEVKGVCNAYRNLDGFFYRCYNLSLEDISFGEHFYYDKITSAYETFRLTGDNI